MTIAAPSHMYCVSRSIAVHAIRFYLTSFIVHVDCIQMFSFVCHRDKSVRRMAFILLQLWFYCELWNWMANSHFVWVVAQVFASMCWPIAWYSPFIYSIRRARAQVARIITIDAAKVQCATNMQNQFYPENNIANIIIVIANLLELHSVSVLCNIAQ